MRMYSVDTIRKGIALLESADAYRGAYSAELISDPELKKLAGEANADFLDIADFCKIWCSAGVESRSEILKLLRIDLQPGDDVEIKMLSLRSGKTAAMISIRPAGFNPELKPDLLFTGLAHRAGLYATPALSEYRKEGRGLIVVEAPGVGANRMPGGISVEDSVDLAESVVTELKRPLRYLMAHSYGYWSLAQLYFKYKETGVPHAEKYIPLMWAPNAEEERAGRKMNPAYVWQTALSMPFAGGATANGAFTSRCFNEHPVDESTRLKDTVRQELLRTNLVNFSRSFVSADKWSILDDIGRDERLVVVLASRDRLVPVEDLAKWKRKGVIILDCDHSGLAGGKFAEKVWHELLGQLKARPDLKLEDFDADDVAQVARANIGAFFRMEAPIDGTHPHFWGGVAAQVDVGLSRYLKLAVRGELAYGGYDEIDRSLVASGAFEFVGIPGRHTRFSIPLGIRGRLNLLEAEVLDPQAYLGLNYNLFDIVEAGIAANFAAVPTFSLEELKRRLTFDLTVKFKF